MFGSRQKTSEGPDALEVLTSQNKLVADMLDEWDVAKARFAQHGDELEENIDARWKEGSVVKLVLQHLAVREAAKQAIRHRLVKAGHEDLAKRLDGDGLRRRVAIERLETLQRGRMAMNLNDGAVAEAVETAASIFRAERPIEESEIVPAAERLLGKPGHRGLPRAASVRMQALTRPSPVPTWYERIPPLKAMLALYQHLRDVPHGLTHPGVAEGREYLPGPKP